MQKFRHDKPVVSFFGSMKKMMLVELTSAFGVGY